MGHRLVWAVVIASILIVQIGSFGNITDFFAPSAEALHGTQILVETSLPPNYTNSFRGADVLTDDSSGNAYLIYPVPPGGAGGGVALAKITPTGTLTKVQLVGPSSTSPLLHTIQAVIASPVARIHDDVLYVFMAVTMPDNSNKYLASKCADLTNIASASCWTKFDGTSGADLLTYEGDFDFGMDIDSSGKVYISGIQGPDPGKLRVRTFAPGGGWSAWQFVGNGNQAMRLSDIEVDDDTGLVHVVVGDATGFIVITRYASGASPGVIPSGLITVTKPPNPDFFVAQGGIATFPNNRVLVLGSTGPWNSWNFFDGMTWVFGTSPPSATAGIFPPFGSTGDIDNVVHGALSKAPDGKGRAFTMKLEGGVNKYELRTFDPDTQSWSAPNTIYTTPPPVHFTVRSVLATRLDPNPNSCNQWYAWFDPHRGTLFADFEGPGKCIVDSFDVEKFYTHTDVNWNPNIDNDGDGLINEDPVDTINNDNDCTDGTSTFFGNPTDNVDDPCWDETNTLKTGMTELIDEDDMDEIKFGTQLPIDPHTGKFLLEAVLKKAGTVSSYNPGQYYAVTKVTVKEDLSNLWIEELFGDCTDRDSGINLSTVNPNKVPGGGAVVIVDPSGNVIDRSDELAASGALFLTDDDNDLITDNAELHLEESIPKDSMVYLYVKFGPGLRGQPLPPDPDNMCHNEEIVSTMIGDNTIEESAEADLIVKPK